MGRAHSSAQDQQPRRRGRGDAAPPLEDVLALQKMAGNRAVATLARETAHKIKPWQQPEPAAPKTERVTATVMLPGAGAVEAWTDMPTQNQASLKELYFTSVDADRLFDVALNAIETGKALGTVHIYWGPASKSGGRLQHATLKGARLSSYQPRGMDASGGSVNITEWSLSFTAFKPGQQQPQR